MRGNRPGRVSENVFTRSIPACAGESPTKSGCTTAATVYPRVCGGIVVSVMPSLPGMGLSQRVRGNRTMGAAVPVVVRSIPACAGESPAGRGPASTVEVYPRVCGGIDEAITATATTEGLSPRVRGNRSFLGFCSSRSRSIPACAGESHVQATMHHLLQVYPRVCGGIAGRRRPDRVLRGLSPRVRGNPQHQSRCHGANRSIPACAGESRRGCGRQFGDGVYPRVCGGIRFRGTSMQRVSGLSPRVRGNRWPPATIAKGQRSIPACAGESQTRSSAG